MKGSKHSVNKGECEFRTLGFEFDRVDEYQAIITPIDIAGERLGTLFIYKLEANIP